MNIKNLLLLCFLLFLTMQTPAFADSVPVNQNPGGNEKIVQTYVNCSIIIEDYSRVQNVLYGIARQYNGEITNFNFNQQSNSGNATVQINPDKINSFLSDLKALGQIESTSFSTSDYTNEYNNYKKRMQIYQKFSNMYPQVIEKLDLSRDEKVLLQSEMTQHINSQITSLKSSMASYEKYNTYTQISIQLRYSKGEKNQFVETERKNINGTVPQDLHKSLGNSGLIIIFVLIIGNALLTLYLLNKIKKNPNFS
jgi:hypothetical protein